MKKIELSSKIIKNDSLVASELDDGLVMMSLENNSYYGLNSIGKRIWELLDEKQTYNELIEKLTQEYDISKEECEKDILELLESLEKEEIISIQ
ncbi:MAG: lasso peptide biosynthesis PqqD family chaperone [Candidatus Sericytochromatia bacterium]